MTAAAPLTEQPAQEAAQPSLSRFSIGDLVDVKGHGRATVIELLNHLPHSPHFGRYLVRYHEDGTTYWCRPKLMRRMYPTMKRILVARSTAAYRDAIVHNVDRPDVCLEIGCHEGLTSNIISNRATFVTGIDTAAEVVEIARRRHPHLSFHQLDGLAVDGTKALSPTGTFSRICIDISGKAPLELVCYMITTQLTAFPDAALIVKNEELFDALVSREQQGGEKQDQDQQVAAGAAAAALSTGQSAAAGDGAVCGCRCAAEEEQQQCESEVTATAAALPPLTRDEHKTMMRASTQQSQPQLQPKSQPQAMFQPASTAPTAPPQGGGTAAGAVLAPAAGAGGGGDDGGCCSMVSRLEELLGKALLVQCEVFRHQFQLPRTRHRAGRGREEEGKSTAAAPPPAPAAIQSNEDGDGNLADRN